MPVTRNGTSSTAPTSEEDGEWRSTDGGEGGASRGVPDSASASGTTTTPGPAFDMAAVLQATVQAAVREAINGIAHLQSQQTAAMPVIGTGETSRLIGLFDPTSSDSPTVDAWIRRVDDLAEVYRWTDRVTSCHALAKLHGPAKMWYDSLQSVNKTWLEWKVELKRAFPTTAGMQRLHREMEDRIYKRGEPIECYYYDKLAKARRCNLSEEACIEYLITALNNQDTIRAISTRTYDSPEELLCCLKRLEERVGTVGSLDSKHSKASELQDLAGHGNKENGAAEMALNKNQQNQENSEPKRETEPSEPRRETPSSEKGGPRCFNCNKYGHLFLKCPSPQRRARCNVCNRSGHEVRNCRERDSEPRLFQSVVDLDIPAADAANEKYFMLAKVNGKEVRAYVDLGIDQATADVPVLIVPNESQAIPIIVGQPFTEQPHVTVVRRRNTVRIFEEEKNVDESDDTLQSIKIPDLPRRPVCLWSKESTVVPPNYVGFVKLYVTGSEPNADVFVDAQLRCQEGREHCIPRCAVKVDAANETCIPVINASYEELSFKANERVARSEIYYLNEEPTQNVKSSCSATRPCSTATVNVKTGPSVTPEHREKLDRLIEEYRDCFADSIAEISRTKAAGMKIKMTTEEPVRSRPCRLSFVEREHWRRRNSTETAGRTAYGSTAPVHGLKLWGQKDSDTDRDVR
ncbi:hypothetical protein MTO96_034453 [Rhipicephalus appendiculatus]